MVVRFKRKRRRGERSYHGRHGYPRGGGNRGGRGNSGKFDHKILYCHKYKPEIFGKIGLKYPSKKEKRIINLQTLSNLVDRLILDGKVKEDSVIEINLNKLGYGKLLSKGNLNKKVIVRVKLASKKAIEKIEKLGGKVILS